MEEEGGVEVRNAGGGGGVELGLVLSWKGGVWSENGVDEPGEDGGGAS